MKRGEELRPDNASSRSEEIAELADDALAITTSRWDCQYINRKTRKRWVFRSRRWLATKPYLLPSILIAASLL